MKAIIALVCFAIALCAAFAADAQQPTALGKDAAAASIPFRKDDNLGEMAVTVGLGLVVAIGAALAALYMLRRYLVRVQQGPGRRLRVIETIRLGPKSALFLVELDGRGLLIGQHGDALALLAQPEPLPPSRSSQADASTWHGPTKPGNA